MNDSLGLDGWLERRFNHVVVVDVLVDGAATAEFAPRVDRQDRLLLLQSLLELVVGVVVELEPGNKMAPSSISDVTLSPFLRDL